MMRYAVFEPARTILFRKISIAFVIYLSSLYCDKYNNFPLDRALRRGAFTLSDVRERKRGAPGEITRRVRASPLRGRPAGDQIACGDLSNSLVVCREFEWPPASRGARSAVLGAIR
jgi:hypothetical protein